jgi:dihydrofolate reductase
MDADLDADTFIVNFDEDPDFETVSESEPVTENGITFRFVIYERKK